MLTSSMTLIVNHFSKWRRGDLPSPTLYGLRYSVAYKYPVPLNGPGNSRFEYIHVSHLVVDSNEAVVPDPRMPLDPCVSIEY